ncbi:MAG: bifunctional phosphoglucose/phosphomannose isomerase [Chloroflexi bacterium]|nr:bifunctional phosphoglucose/phosphomannose isomerase [Chloroflexota bacterium]
MIDLDNPQTLKKNDRGEMGLRLSELPLQCRTAWQIAQEWSPPAEYREVDSAIILGMGGSAIGGDLLRGLVSDSCPLPIFLLRDYSLPHFAGSRTLVIASSFSGDTEETLFAFQQALQRDCKTLAISTGGRLAQLAEGSAVPLLTFNYPPPPRAATGFSLVLLLGVFYHLGLIPDPSPDLEEGIALLESGISQFREEVPTSQNPAKQLAEKIQGRIPVFWGAEHLHPVARRWKTQANENSKLAAFFEALPEIHHNAVVGLRFPTDLAQKIFVVVLTSNLLHPRNLLRVQVTAEVLAKEKIPYQVIEVLGETRLAEVLWGVLLGDYVSLYLAARNGVDPSEIEVISQIKKRMAEGWR